MSKKNKEPTWQLTAGYGCATDAYNWVLLKKSGKRWRSVGYYPTPEKMLMGLYRKICRSDPVNPDLAQHVDAISERVQAAAARLSDELNRMAWSRLHRPPAHPEPTND